MKTAQTLARTRWFADGGSQRLPVQAAEEAEVRLSVNGEAWLSFLCSPEDLEALAVGFLYNEGFIQTAAEVAAVHICDARDHIDLWLTRAVEKPQQWSRTSGCQGGAVQSGAPPALGALEAKPLAWADLFARVDAFASALTGLGSRRQGLHTSMLLDRQVVRLASSDIGRHNTLDKLAGARLLSPLDLREPALITTGRISAEMVAKAARMRVALVISLHSASDMAITAAQQLGVLLVGHARRSQLDVYTYPERILHTEIENSG